MRDNHKQKLKFSVQLYFAQPAEQHMEFPWQWK